MSKVFALLFVFVCAIYAHGQEITQGSLLAAAKDGKELGSCPLKSTAVKSEISGFLARVNVRQEFKNEFDQPIEAVFVFPLSQNGAVDDMLTDQIRAWKKKVVSLAETVAKQTPDDGDDW